MARPDRVKRICRLPHFYRFAPSHDLTAGNTVRLQLEEYEAIRLIDYMGMTQQDCASQMGVSRACVQAIYRDARKKLSRFLIEGTSLVIEGGEVAVCGSVCMNNHAPDMCAEKEAAMKLAVTYENGEIFQHFGHTETFKVYDVEDGQIVNSEVVSANGAGHGALAGFLSDLGVTKLICGGIGGGARNALAEAGIEVYPGAMGNADENAASFVAGSLVYNPDTMCNHHGEGHSCGSHKEGHSCGNHSCGQPQ